MKEVLEKFKKGTTIEFGNNKAVIISDLMKLNEFYYLIADVTKNIDFNMPCATRKITENLALIIRDKELLLKMGFSKEERKAIYCHELGHSFSENQQIENNDDKRCIETEINCDTFAIEKCGISSEILENALRKTYEYEIKNIDKKQNMTQERLDRFVNEMRLRKRNIERIRSNNKKNTENDKQDYTRE